MEIELANIMIMPTRAAKVKIIGVQVDGGWNVRLESMTKDGVLINQEIDGKNGVPLAENEEELYERAFEIQKITMELAPQMMFKVLLDFVLGDDTI